MSEEEKRALSRIKYDFRNDEMSEITLYSREINDIYIILKLIEKQQKEIKNSISKDKIRELIEECKKEGCCSNKEYYDNKCLEICRFYEVCTLLRNLLERK